MNTFNWTPLRTAFCEQMLVCDFNATAAYKAAGGTAKHADRAAAQINDLPEIKQRIDELKLERSERTKVDADYVLNRLVEIDQMDVLDIHSEDGSLKPLHQWPKIWRQFISGMDLSELFEGRGDDRQMVGVLKKIKWPDKVKNLELIGKHVEVQAFKERVEHSGHITHEEMLEQLK